VTSRQIVIPGPDSFGSRVTPATPLGHVVSILRRYNPDASYAQIKLAAEDLRNGHGRAAEPEGEPQVSREPGPEPFDSATDASTEVPQDATATVPASEVADPTRDQVKAWLDATGGVQLKPGRIPKHIMQAYRDAHREEMVASMVPVEGGGDPIPAEPPEPPRY